MAAFLLCEGLVYPLRRELPYFDSFVFAAGDELLLLLVPPHLGDGCRMSFHYI
jgi:hypothetical protein